MRDRIDNLVCALLSSAQTTPAAAPLVSDDVFTGDLSLSETVQKINRGVNKTHKEELLVVLHCMQLAIHIDRCVY